MKTILRTLFILSIILFVFSCRQIPEDEKMNNENISPGGLVSIKTNLKNIEWINNTNENPLVSENNSEGEGKSLKNNNLNTYTQDLGVLGVAEIEEIIETPENNEYLASLGLSSKLVEKYPYDVTTIIAYKKNKDNTHTFDKIVYVEKDGNFELTGDQNYTLFLHSGRVPIGNIKDKEDIERIAVYNENISLKPFVQRIDDFIPNGYKTIPLDVKLKYPGSYVTIIFDSTDIIGGNIDKAITLVDSSVHENEKSHTKAYSQYLNSGIIDFNEEKIIKKREFIFKNDNKQIVTYNFGNTLVRGDLEFTVDVKVEIEGLTEAQTIKIPLKNLERSYKHVFKIKLKRCGAYLGPNKTNWRQFMCHNLGADYGSNPFVPSAKIHGAKYQWGKYESLLDRTGKFISVWDTTSVVSSTEWLKGNNKTIKDPCPEGYRIPTRREYQLLLTHNIAYKEGPWDIGYDSALRIGSNLVLPLGDRVVKTGANKVYEQGKIGGYWSSTLNLARAYALDINAYKLAYVSVNSDHRVNNSAMSIRCIKED